MTPAVSSISQSFFVRAGSSLRHIRYSTGRAKRQRHMPAFMGDMTLYLTNMPEAARNAIESSSSSTYFVSLRRMLSYL